MSEWTCTGDNRRLTDRARLLHCPHCHAEYPVIDGVPVFGEQAHRPSTDSDSTALETLWDLVRAHPAAEAAQRFCADHPCSTTRFTADWQSFVPASPHGRMLELGAGFGDDTLDLADKAAEVVSLVPDLRNARILDKRLREAGRRNVSVAVLGRFAKLPLPAGSLAMIALESAAAASFGITDRTFRDVASEFARVVTPGGEVHLGLRHARANLLPLGLVAQRRRGRRRVSLNRFVKSGGEVGSSGLRLGATIRAMTDAGFGRPRILAPLPDEESIELVLPIEDRGVLDYCFSHLLRKNSPLVRAAIRGAGLVARLNGMRSLVPYCFLTFRATDGAG